MLMVSHGVPLTKAEIRGSSLPHLKPQKPKATQIANDSQLQITCISFVSLQEIHTTCVG